MIDISLIAKNGALFDGRYKLLKTLSSEGGTADVWLALDTNTIDEFYDEDADALQSQEETGIKVAIKIYRPKNALDIGDQRFRDEFKIVFNCHHTNLVQPINFSIYEGIPYLVLPYCKNGSSEKLQGKISDKNELWRYISDVSAGLAYLHSFNPTIVHHDIKPANVLIDDNNNYAITDFGISSHSGFNRDGYEDTHSGTMAYMAPERFKDDYESTPESDIWSFGATLYELITGKVPFGEYGGQNQLETNASVPPITQSVPKDIKKLVYDCLSLNASKRPTAKYIYKASQAKQYPKKRTGLFLGIGLAVCLVVASILASVSVLKHEEVPEPPVIISNEETFANAIALINQSNLDSVAQGVAILDSLSSIKYIPAIYELAFTYGWYSDEISVSRKKTLNIETYTSRNTRNANEYTLPVSDNINNKAIGLLTKIVELNDSSYPEINANALYRLACYYTMTDKVVRNDLHKGESLLKQARQWAIQCDDSILIERIDRGLASLQNK